MIGGNIAILAASARTPSHRPHDSIPVVPGVNHPHAVDRRVRRSSAPTREAYRTLAARNVRTVVDLRAEDDVREDGEFLLGLGVVLVRFPIRDGQTPSAVQANQFIEAVQSFEGVVLVHCGAGVGRTGTMAAAYLVRSGEATPNEALWRNLAVGPPSLEQISHVAGLGRGVAQPNLIVRAASRTLDAPRRLWSRWRSRSPGLVSGHVG